MIAIEKAIHQIINDVNVSNYRLAYGLQKWEQNPYLIGGVGQGVPDSLLLPIHTPYSLFPLTPRRKSVKTFYDNIPIFTPLPPWFPPLTSTSTCALTKEYPRHLKDHPFVLWTKSYLVIILFSKRREKNPSRSKRLVSLDGLIFQAL